MADVSVGTYRLRRRRSAEEEDHPQQRGEQCPSPSNSLAEFSNGGDERARHGEFSASAGVA
eukprot:3340639-Pyramimonas_sp.AAC.1